MVLDTGQRNIGGDRKPEALELLGTGLETAGAGETSGMIGFVVIAFSADCQRDQFDSDHKCEPHAA